MLLILQALSRLFAANSAAITSAATTTEKSTEDDALNLPPRLQALVSSRYPSIPRHLDLASVPHSPPKKCDFKTAPQILLRSQSSIQIPLESSLTSADDDEEHKRGTAASSSSHGNHLRSHRYSQHRLSLSFEKLNQPSYNDVCFDEEEDDADFFTDSFNEDNAITAIESPAYYSSEESEESPRVSYDVGSGTIVSFERPSPPSRFGTFHSFCASHMRTAQTNKYQTKHVSSHEPFTRSSSFSQEHSYHDVTAYSKYEQRQEHSTLPNDEGMSPGLEEWDDEADNEFKVFNSARSTFPAEKSLAAESFIANSLSDTFETEESLLVQTPVDKSPVNDLSSNESHPVEHPKPEDSSNGNSISVKTDFFNAKVDEVKSHEQDVDESLIAASSDKDLSINHSFNAGVAKDYIPSDVLFSMMNPSDLGSEKVDVPMKYSCKAGEVELQKEEDPQKLQSRTGSDGAQRQNEQVISSHRPDERLEQPFRKESIVQVLCEKRTSDALCLNFKPNDDEEIRCGHGKTKKVVAPDSLEKHLQHSFDGENQSKPSESETQVDVDESHAPDENEKAIDENNDTTDAVLVTPKHDTRDKDESMILERISAVCALATTYRAAQVVLYACGSTAHLWLRTPPPPPVTIFIVDDESGKINQTVVSQSKNTFSLLPNNVDVKHVRCVLGSENWDIDLIDNGFDWHLPSVWIADIDIAHGCLGSYEEIDSFLRIVYSLTNPQSTVLLLYPGKISIPYASVDIDKHHGNEGEQQPMQSATDFSPRSFERFVSRRSFRVLYDKKIEGDNYLDVHVAALVQKSFASNATSPPHSDISDPNHASKDDGSSHRKKNEIMSKYGSDTVEGPSVKRASFGTTNYKVANESKDDVSSASTNTSMTMGRPAEQGATSEKLTEESEVKEEAPDEDNRYANTRTVEFRLSVESIPGDLGCRASGAIVIGNESILGCWTASGAQLMEGNVHDRSSTLTKSVVLENVGDIGILEYKYALVHSGQIVAWEVGNNRLICEASHLPTDSVHILDESWRN